eukprot:COSAG02_NODE_3746_length_6295_cov_35.811653_2_plen_1379_part_00
MQIEMAEFVDSGDSSGDRRGDGEIPPANCVGRTLAHTVDCCSVPFPCGACVALAVCFATAVCLSAWGINTYDIVGDVDPNIDGFIPRRTEIGNRINTATILFDRDADGFDGQLDKQCKLYSTCLSHRPQTAAPVTPVEPGDRPTEPSLPPLPQASGCTPTALQTFCPALESMPAMCSQTVSNGVTMAQNAAPGLIDAPTMACIQQLTGGKHPEVLPTSSLAEFCPGACPAGPGDGGECSAAAFTSELCPVVNQYAAICGLTVASAVSISQTLLDASSMACIQKLTTGAVVGTTVTNPEVDPSQTVSQLCSACEDPGEPDKCVDDPMGLLATAGYNCEQMLSFFPPFLPDPCDSDLHDTAQMIGVAVPEGLTAAIICPVSCGDCPGTGTRSGETAAGSGYGGETPAPPSLEPSGEGRRRSLQHSVSVQRDNSGNEYCTRDSGYCYTVIFDRKDGTSLYTAESFRSICKWEDDVLQYGLDTDHHHDTDGMPFCQENPSGAAGCCIPPSVPRLVADKAGTTCDQLTDRQIQSTLCNILSGVHDHTYELLVGGGPFGSGRLTAEAFGANSVHSQPLCGNHEYDISSRAATSWLRSRVCTHHSGGSDSGRKEFLTDLWMDVGEAAFEADAESHPVQATFRDHIEGAVNNKFVFKDLYWALFSFLLIFIYIAVVTNSIYLATLGMTHIFLSFFCTYAIYKTAIHWLAGVGWFPFLLWLGLFVICGIGADDIFVYVDAWRQSQVILPKSTPLANRISWVHHRASMAMLITSFTTACAFFSNTVNYVIPVGLFGAFMALLVVLNYVLVCTMFPAAVVVYHFFLEDRTWKNMLRWPLHGPGAGACCPASIYAPPSLSAVRELDEDAFTGGWTGAQLRSVEKFFESIFAPGLFRLRNPVVGACTVLTLVILFSYTLQMEKETSKVNLWPQWYPMEVYRSANDEGWPDHYDTSWGCEPGCEDVYFIWGVEATDDGNILDFDDLGQLHFEDKFTLTAESVAWLEGLMAALRGLSMFAPRAEENGKRSPLEALTHTDEAGQSTPLIPVSLVEMASYPVSQFGGGCGEGESQPWEECFNSYVRDAPARASSALRMMGQNEAVGTVQDLLEHLFDTFVTYDESGELKTFSLVLHSTLDGTDDGLHGIWDYPVRTAQWEEIEKVFNEHLKNAPVGWETGFFLAFGFIGKDLQDSMQFSAIESGSIAVVLAFFTLLVFTDDLLMSGLASLAILVTLILVIGWLVAIGWKLGVLESMCMAISVGICVDFICHHAHAYSHCDSNSRKDRITHSLVEMGISVVSAAVTTFTAAAILLVFTTVTFFQKFGVFLAVCMICSVVVALVYFHALLAIAGPLGGGGGLRNRLKTACNKITGRSDHDSEVLATLAVSADDITFG